MFTSQQGNFAHGDVVGRDKTEVHHHHARPLSPLDRLYEVLRAANQETTSEIPEQLQHLCTVATEGDVRGLEEKLRAGAREDLIPTAIRLKELATKIVMKWQTSVAAQDILTFILSKMHTDFLLHVSPAIQGDANRAVVDRLISDYVLAPTQTMLGDNDLRLNPGDLLGLLFFLAGNCHVRWDKC